MRKWDSFWDLASPKQAATIVAEVYGAAAEKEALSCALEAESNNRDEDYRFWIAVLGRLRANRSPKLCLGPEDPNKEIRVSLPISSL